MKSRKREGPAALSTRRPRALPGLSRAVLAASMHGFFAFQPDGRIVEVNEAACRLLGYSRAELLSLSMVQLEAKRGSPEMESRCQRILSAGNDRFATRLRCKDGHEVDVELSAGSQKGAKPLLFGFARDMTQRIHTEQSLREGERRYRILAEASPNAIFILGRDLRVEYVNSAASSLWGRTPEELLGRCQDELFPAEIARRHRNVVARIFKTGEAARRDELIPFPGGGRWLETRLTPIRGDDGVVTSVLGVAHDITERKRSEFLLQAQRDVGTSLSLTSNLKTALKGLLEIVVQLEGLDCGGVYLLEPGTGALRLEAFSGISVEFAQRVSFYPATTSQTRLVNEGKAVYAPFESILPHSDPTFPGPGLKVLAVLPLCHEGMVLGSLNASSHTRDEVPEQTRVVIEAIAAQAAGAIARLRTEKALFHSEARLRAITASVPIVLFAADRDGIITFEDGKALAAFGGRPGGNIGRPLREVYSGLPQFLENARRALLGEEFSSVLEVNSHCFDCWYSPARDKDGGIIGFVGVATDITERQRLERQILEISDREQARIGQDIHDGLCQQLVSLAFDANALERELSAGNRAESATASRIAAYLDQAITDSRQLSRGLFPVRLESEGLSSALAELVFSTRERHRVDCLFESDPDVVETAGPLATHLYRIAQEAVSNALNHGHARRIQVRLAARNGQVELTIEDDGSGLATEAARTSKGMGLRIMDYRARSIGGRLRLAASPLGGVAVCCCAPLPRG